MDQTELLKEFRAYLDDKVSTIRDDVQKIDSKLDNYQERIVKLETNMGFIKVGLSFIATVITSTITYLVYKYILPTPK